MQDGFDIPSESRPPLSLDSVLEDFIGLHQADPTVDLEGFLEQFPVATRQEIRQRCLGYMANLAAFTPGDTRRHVRTAPETIGPYRVEERIGTGGMATVYRAVDERSGEERALKILHPHLAGSPTAIRRFEREFQVMTRLRHPRLATLLELGHDGEWHYIVMERVYSTSLAKVEPPEEVGERTRWALALCADICEALEYIHEHDVIHRDVKPGNILMNAKGRPALADFGFARMFDALSLSLTTTGQLIGTPYYMSPEQVLARKVGVDARSDIFSLGAILYELLTGVRPFAGTSEDQVFYAISFTDVRSPRELQPELPVDVETVCLMALEKAPTHRYPSAAAMGADLKACLAEAPISARRPGQLRLAGRRLARSRVTVAGVALFGALAASVGVIAVDWSRHAEEDLAKTAELTVRTAEPGAQVSLRRLDMVTGDFGPGAPLGATPLVGARVEPGYYRIVITDAEGQFQELSRHLKPGSEMELEGAFRDEQALTAGMILMPEGRFLAGQHPDSDLFPEVEAMGLAFYADPFEVTMGEYKAFLDANPSVPWPALWGDHYDPAWSDLPAVGMTWYQAREYAEFAGKRLLTRGERLRIARGVDAREMLPGLEDGNWKGNAAVGMNDGQRGAGFTAFLGIVPPVGSYPKDVTPEGIYDVLGGVTEWVDGLGITYDKESILAVPGQRHAIGESWNIPGTPLIHPISSLPGATYLSSASVGIRCGRSTEASAQGPPSR